LSVCRDLCGCGEALENRHPPPPTVVNSLTARKTTYREIEYGYKISIATFIFTMNGKAFARLEGASVALDTRCRSK
jgi:hypothetical protein